jgi:glutathione synthase/RimK-type ligase-like ATP-grasp enzyme
MNIANKILVVTSSYDKTVDYIMEKYKHINWFRLNVDEFSIYKINVDKRGFTISSNDTDISSLSCRSIYYRKPAFEDLSGIIESKYYDFAHKECLSVIEGIVEGFSGICLTKPSVMRVANNKVFQSSIASRCGLNIPDFNITNDFNQVPSESKKLIVKPVASGQVIYGNEKEYVQTNLMDSRFPLDYLKYSPSYFQDYIDKDFEVRVTIVGENCFPVKIESEDNVDWRIDNNKVLYSEFSLPEFIKHKLKKFMSACSMQFGCFDLLYRDGEWFFLEMNANGQWAWLEFELEIDISKSIVDLLWNRDIEEELRCQN